MNQQPTTDNKKTPTDDGWELIRFYAVLIGSGLVWALVIAFLTRT